MAHDQRPQVPRLGGARRPGAAPVILASASPRRRLLLRTLGVAFRVVVPRVAEARHRRTSPRQLVRHNARIKAEYAAGRIGRGIVVAADTVVVCQGRIFGKPRTMAQARAMLRTLGGRWHRVYTGVCVQDVECGRTFLDVEITRVRLRRVHPAQLDRTLRDMRPSDKAGGYAVQNQRVMMIDRMEGSFSNVMGLPLQVVERRLRACGMVL